MKRYVLLFILLGCTHQRQDSAIIHDYMMENAKKICLSNNGLHYIVLDKKIYDITNESKPCSDKYQARCQDGKVYNLDTEIKFCAVSEYQLQETLNGEQKSD